MSRKKQRNAAPKAVVDKSPNQGTQQSGALGTMLMMDAYSNAIARLGVGQNNIIEASEYPITRRTQDYALMNSLYRNEWIARRIIDTVPEDMCKNWYEITSQVDPDQQKQLERIERTTYLKHKLIEGLRWGRLYGGAAAIIVVEGQEEMLEEPLDLRMIMPGQFKGLIIADRWSGVYPSSEICEDLGDPDFGLPDYYYFSMDAAQIERGVKVHHSRVIRFIGRDLPYIERLNETYWGMSEIEHVYTELNKRNAVSANLAQMIFQANLRVLKMSDFGEVLSSTTPQQQADLYSMLSAQNMLMTSMGVQVMDREDSLESHQYTFSGLPDLYELFMLDVSGASEIPATKLFGRSPQGMNATGESDLTNYYDSIRQKQESVLRPILDKLLPVLCMSAWGMVPEDLEYEFKQVRDTSDEERANLVQQTSGAINNVFQAGLISQRIALKELRSTESYTGMWSSITDEDIEKADDDLSGGADDAGAEGFPEGAEGGGEMPEEGMMQMPEMAENGSEKPQEQPESAEEEKPEEKDDGQKNDAGNAAAGRKQKRNAPKDDERRTSTGDSAGSERRRWWSRKR